MVQIRNASIVGVTLGAWLLARAAIAQPCGEEIVLRDSIGPDNSTTNGNGWYSSTYDLEDETLYLTPVQLFGIGRNDVTLGRLRVVLGGYDTLGWDVFTYTVRVWDSWDALIANPRNGNANNVPFPTPTSMQLYGSDLEGNETYEAIFELESDAIVLPKNGRLWIAVEVTTPDQDHYGIVGPMESTEAQPPPPDDEPDRQICHHCPPPGWQFTTHPDYTWRLYDGRLAYEVLGETISSGDIDIDGDVDVTDFALFADCMAGPGLPGACDPVVAALADIDDDNDVDLHDFAQFQLNFGQSCP